MDYSRYNNTFNYEKHYSITHERLNLLAIIQKVEGQS